MATAFIKTNISFVVFLCYIWINIACSVLLCPEECNCLGPMVDCSKKKLESVPKQLPNWVQFLDLSSNNIEEVEPSYFEGKRELSKLHLSNNRIQELKPELFSKLPSLKTLKVTENELGELPLFPPKYNLTRLVLNHNKIRGIEWSNSESLFKLRNLNLSYNLVNTLDNRSFPLMPNLHNLYLSNNRINTITPACFDNIPNLESLYLAHNHITDIPKGVFKMRQLRSLDLEGNDLQVLEGLTFEGMESLSVLKLSRNNLNRLADGCFWGLDSIQHLELMNNSFTQLTKAGLFGLTSLKTLSLSNNEISDIEEGSWEYCESLTSLDLTNNKLEKITSGTFAELKSLETLLLNNNLISYIGVQAFDDLSNLKILEMNGNALSWSIEDMFGPFEGLASLTHLTLEANQIKTIAKKAFQGLPMLEHLDLLHNEVSTIQNNAFEELKELKKLMLNTSALLCDCELGWFPNWLKTTNFLSSSVVLNCSHPQSLRGWNVLDVEQFKCDQNPKPVILTSPADQIALKGGSFSLRCVAWSSSNSTMIIEWRKDNIAVSHAKMNTTATLLSEGVQMESVLMISIAQDEHQGDYQCVAENEVGPTYSPKAEIKVHVFPVFIKQPKNFTVKAGAKIELECAAVGHPPPEISWQKDGGDDFPAARERRMHIQQDNDIYFISSVKVDDMGIYSCMASNDAGTVVTNATLTVLEIPKFSEPMVDEKVEQGETAVLKCRAQGSPKPRLHWLKNDAPVEPSLTERHFFTADDQLLVIVEARPEDAGKYTCVMTNNLGQERGSMELVVISHGGGGRVAGLFTDNYTTTGIVIIAVVCCVVGTSLIWVVIIYQTRRKQEEYSSTPTEETAVPELAYNSIDQHGCTRTIYTAQGAYSKVYTNNGTYNSLQPNNGAHMDGGFNITPNPMAHDWDAIVEYEQDHRETNAVPPSLSNSSSNNNINKLGGHTHIHHAQCHTNTRPSVGRCDSSISFQSSSSSSSSDSHSPGTHCSTVVLSTFHPYPLGNPPSAEKPQSAPSAGASSIVRTSHPHMLQEGCPASAQTFPSSYSQKCSDLESQKDNSQASSHDPQHSSSFHHTHEHYSQTQEKQPLLDSPKTSIDSNDSHQPLLEKNNGQLYDANVSNHRTRDSSSNIYSSSSSSNDISLDDNLDSTNQNSRKGRKDSGIELESNESINKQQKSDSPLTSSSKANVNNPDNGCSSNSDSNSTSSTNCDVYNHMQISSSSSSNASTPTTDPSSSSHIAQNALLNKCDSRIVTCENNNVDSSTCDDDDTGASRNAESDHLLQSNTIAV